MTSDSWIQLDAQRASWLFLVIKSPTEEDVGYTDRNQDGRSLASWELGIGHAECLVETTAERINCGRIADECDLIDALLAEFDQYRYTSTMIITPDHRTIPQLRRRILATATTGSTSSLRGFTHLDVKALLSEYFEQDLSEYGIDRESRTLPRKTETGPDEVVSTGTIRDLSELWNQIFRLVPPSELIGQRL